MGVLSFAALLSLGAYLNLEDPGSEIRFGTAGTQTIVTAACEADAPAVRKMSPNSMKAADAAGTVLKFWLMNVPPTCIGLAAARPCVDHVASSDRGYFYCKFTSSSTAVEHVAGPFKASTELIEKHGVKLGIESSLECPLTADTVEQLSTANSHDGTPISFQVSVLHGDAPSTASALSYRGFSGGDLLTLSRLPGGPPLSPPSVPPSAPPSPPASPPSTPPSTPPPPPPPPDPAHYDAAVVALTPATLVKNTEDRVTEWRDRSYATTGKTCFVRDVSGGSAHSLSTQVVANGISGPYHPDPADGIIECNNADMHVDVDNGHSFIVALVANHEVNQQAYADSWIVSPDEPYGSRVDSERSYNFGIGNVHHWGFGNSLCGDSAWHSVAQGVVAEVTIYESSGSGSFKEYRCNQGSLDLMSTCTTMLPGPFRHAITLFEHPFPSHSGHDARGSLAEVAVWRSDSQGGFGTASDAEDLATKWCTYAYQKYLL